MNREKCIYCEQLTEDKHKFCDDPDDEIGYWDWCCDECYEKEWRYWEILTNP